MNKTVVLSVGAITGATIVGGIAKGCKAKTGFLIMWIAVGALAGGFSTQIAFYG